MVGATTNCASAACTNWGCAMTRASGDETEDHDVPIRVDVRDVAMARAWIEATRGRRPYRPRFFTVFCAAMQQLAKPLRILELGSGPDQLDREILIRCQTERYVALDFSPAIRPQA